MSSLLCFFLHLQCQVSLTALKEIILLLCFFFFIVMQLLCPISCQKIVTPSFFLKTNLLFHVGPGKQKNPPTFTDRRSPPLIIFRSIVKVFQFFFYYNYAVVSQFFLSCFLGYKIQQQFIRNLPLICGRDRWRRATPAPLSLPFAESSLFKHFLLLHDSKLFE